MIFEILWYAGGPEYAPNRCIGRDYIRRNDLTSACKRAASLFAASKGDAALAHGLYVRMAEDQTRLPTTR